MLSLTDLLDNAILLSLSLKASECVFKRFIFFYTNLAHYIPSLCLIAGVITNFMLLYTLIYSYVKNNFQFYSKFRKLFCNNVDKLFRYVNFLNNRLSCNFGGNFLIGLGGSDSISGRNISSNIKSGLQFAVNLNNDLNG